MPIKPIQFTFKNKEIIKDDCINNKKDLQLMAKEDTNVPQHENFIQQWPSLSKA